jgi:hypothetical protein
MRRSMKNLLNTYTTFSGLTRVFGELYLHDVFRTDESVWRAVSVVEYPSYLQHTLESGIRGAVVHS